MQDKVGTYVGNMYYPAKQPLHKHEERNGSGEWVGHIGGRLYYQFTSAEGKQYGIKRREEELQRLIKGRKKAQRLAHKKWLPPLDLKAGFIGSADCWVVQVEHVEGPNESIVKIIYGSDERGQLPWNYTPFEVLLVNYPTTDLVDGKNIFLHGPYQVGKPKQVDGRTLYPIGPVKLKSGE